MQTQADVVVIGAGVIGCSTAYHLAQRGVRNVVVLEMGQMGGGSSSQSAAMLSVQFCRDELTLQMAQYSYERYMRFAEEMGTPIDFHPHGWIYIAGEDSAAELQQHATLLQRMNVTCELLKPDELKRLYPELNVDDIVLATFGPDDGPVDPHMIIAGYMRRARQLGVQLREGVQARDIVLEGGKVVGVESSSGTIATETIVNAAGPWAARVAGWAGVDVPLRNSARSIVVTNPVPAIPSDRPFVDDFGLEWYFRPEVDGVLMGMGDRPVADPDRVSLDEAQVESIIDIAIHRVPALETASLLTAWTGVRPLTADGQAIVGPVAEVEGLVLNCGWGGVGIIMAPIAGQLAAEYVVDGKARTVAGAALALERFRAR